MEKTKPKLQKSDFLFLAALLGCAALFAVCIHGFPGYVDESFYPTAALRLINGDSLIKDEWHLSQFSSVFLYLPVRFWLTVNGSTEGMILFFRYIYTAIHCACAAGVYLFFRKHGTWAVLAAVLFCTQTPMQIVALSYNSLFALFILAFSFLLFTLRDKQKPALYILTGLVYACACICNPVFCGVFFLYLLVLCVVRYQNSDFHKENIALRNKERKKNNKKLRKMPEHKEEFDIFFSNKALLFFFVGILIAAVCAIVFFFATGGTLTDLEQNFKHLLTDSEHSALESPIIGLLTKIAITADAFNTISFKLFFLPFIPLIALIFDKKRNRNSHRLIFLAVSFALASFYTAGIATAVMKANGNVHFFTLPFLMISLTAYILTNNKNKKMFYLLWLPGAFAAGAQFLASNLALLAIGWPLAISNIAGVFFVKDLFLEMAENREECKKAVLIAGRTLLCLGLVLQLTFQTTSLLLRYLPDKEEDRIIERGPYEDLYVNKRYYGTFDLSLDDMDKIKERSNEDDPVLILSDMTWLYLYIDRPFGSYSAWQLSFEPDRLRAYYELNPEKRPKYIYVSAVVPRSDYGVSFKTAEAKVAVMKEMFHCSEEKLSRGILLTVLE